MEKRKITIIGAGMMGSALAFPAAENGHEVHIVGTCLDDEIIDGYLKTGKHEKFCRPFPENVSFHYFKEWEQVVEGSDFVIGGVSSFGVDWFWRKFLRDSIRKSRCCPLRRDFVLRTTGRCSPIRAIG